MPIKPSDFVLILGLSDDSSRYSYKAMVLLKKFGFATLIGSHPTLTEVDGVTVVKQLDKINQSPHTVTVYLNPQRFLPLIPELKRLNPKRVILNPGADDPSVVTNLKSELPDAEILQACTLVLLQTRQF